MSQNLPVKNFEWIKDTSQFSKDFMKNYNGESDKIFFLKLMFNIPRKTHERHDYLPFLLERMKIKKVKKVVANLHDKTE